MSGTGAQPTSGALDARPRYAPLLRRPELGSIAGAVFVALFFALYARSEMFSLGGIVSFLEPSAQLGILAVAAAMLMIAGEFDLSVGSMIAFGGMAVGVPLALWGWPLEAAVLCALLLAGAVGLLHGAIVLRTGLPSFIVTLAALFVLRGVTLVGLKWATGGATQLRGIREAVPESHWLMRVLAGNAFEPLFTRLAERGWIASFKSGLPKVQGIPVEILWFIALTAIAAWILRRSAFGNWVFAAGGDAVVSRNVGVPVARVKTLLFCATACAGALLGVMNALDFGSTDAARGTQKEFEAIIAAVIGGCLLTGGYGSIIGAFFGAIIFGMVAIGITYTEIDQDMYKIFLGVMLLLAVVLNRYLRNRILGAQ